MHGRVSVLHQAWIWWVRFLFVKLGHGECHFSLFVLCMKHAGRNCLRWNARGNLYCKGKKESILLVCTPIAKSSIMPFVSASVCLGWAADTKMVIRNLQTNLLGFYSINSVYHWKINQDQFHHFYFSTHISLFLNYWSRKCDKGNMLQAVTERVSTILSFYIVSAFSLFYFVYSSCFH
jgi:hypothetical protein